MMSLWKVDDEATRLLFESFYKNWMTGKRSIDEAFQLAQQEIKKVYKDPYYWGAFVLVN
jgi:CHAT domain-containing protein